MPLLMMSIGLSNHPDVMEICVSKLFGRVAN
jgi:hypothetical protein